MCVLKECELSLQRSSTVELILTQFKTTFMANEIISDNCAHNELRCVMKLKSKKQHNRQFTLQNVTNVICNV